MTQLRLYLVISLMLAVLAGVFAAWCATHFFSSAAPEPSLHRIIQNELGLTADQRAQVSEIEARYTAQRQTREREMRAANARLAAAIEADHQLDDNVRAAIQDFHHAMGELQLETIRYVLDVREILNEDQRVHFDATVTASLTDQDW
ncbi:periplasmic heavy metal sensor [Alkalicaulis satelles]|uniref:Periplasmic heavy metal sensor n=1 Tax=Alkalicaulis satelles TaxID=2609175 RepID=A0A5M6ZKR8_9PROT|nr:periplasmic heavy metal sensor [Alkalicaulis satelles]KAA5805426.1 periplasmic heavy metal sensor [Alkalicaulis satelles]